MGWEGLGTKGAALALAVEHCLLLPLLLLALSLPCMPSAVAQVRWGRPSFRALRRRPLLAYLRLALPASAMVVAESIGSVAAAAGAPRPSLRSRPRCPRRFEVVTFMAARLSAVELAAQGVVGNIYLSFWLTFQARAAGARARPLAPLPAVTCRHASAGSGNGVHHHHRGGDRRRQATYGEARGAPKPARARVRLTHPAIRRSAYCAGPCH